MLIWGFYSRFLLVFRSMRRMLLILLVNILVITPSLLSTSMITNNSIVHINAGAGQPGIGLANFPEPIPYLTAPDFGGYYACNNTLPSGSAIQLLYKYYGESTPEGCADVTLLPQCVVNGTVEEFGNTENCYTDVKGIDWSVYSA